MSDNLRKGAATNAVQIAELLARRQAHDAEPVAGDSLVELRRARRCTFAESRSMRTLKLTLAYDGTAYAGWQVQVGPADVQDALEAALAKITGETIASPPAAAPMPACMRWARSSAFEPTRRCSADVLSKRSTPSCPRHARGVVVEAAPGFHARRDAVRKRYRYVIHDVGRQRFRRHHVWQCRWPDWTPRPCPAPGRWSARTTFAVSKRAARRGKRTVRTVFDIDVARGAAPCITSSVEVEADGFLYNMVRTIVGTLTKLGTWRGRRSLARRRCWPPATAAPPAIRAAQGLCLLHVEYAENIVHDRRRLNHVESAREKVCCSLVKQCVPLGYFSAGQASRDARTRKWLLVGLQRFVAHRRSRAGEFRLGRIGVTMYKFGGLCNCQAAG